MELWQFVLYAVASLFALRSLVSLMTQHKQEFKKELLDRETQRLEKEARAAAAALLEQSRNKAA